MNILPYRCNATITSPLSEAECMDRLRKTQFCVNGSGYQPAKWAEDASDTLVFTPEKQGFSPLYYNSFVPVFTVTAEAGEGGTRLRVRAELRKSVHIIAWIILAADALAISVVLGRRIVLDLAAGFLPEWPNFIPMILFAFGWSLMKFGTWCAKNSFVRQAESVLRGKDRR